MPTPSSFLGIDLVIGAACRRLVRRALASCRLLRFFPVICLLLSKRGLRSSLWLTSAIRGLCVACRLLNYDVVLNVELIVHVHNVDLHSLASPRGCTFLLFASSSALVAVHVCRDDSLHMEILLLLVSTTRHLLVSLARAALHTSLSISLLLDVLSWVSRATISNLGSTHASSPTSRLRWGLILALHREVLARDCTLLASHSMIQARIALALLSDSCIFALYE